MRHQQLELYNIRSVFERPDGPGLQLSRVPAALRNTLNPNAQMAALNGCGCELRFNLLSEQATIWLQRADPRLCDPTGVAEIWYGPFQAAYEISPRMIGQQPTPVRIGYPKELALLEQLAQEQNLSYDPRLVRILLPYDLPNYLIEIEGELAPPRSEQAPQKRYLAYGSSITHGGNSLTPSESYAMRVARGLGYDLLNFGFAGSAQFEPTLADFFADELEWDLATLELGINVIGSWSVEEFAERIAYFIPRIAQRHPDRWIICTDLFSSKYDLLAHPNIEGYRSAVRETVAAQNLPRLRYVDGRTLLPDLADLNTDLVHPASSGMEIIAQNLLRTIHEHQSSE